MTSDLSASHWSLVPPDFMVQLDCRHYVGEKPCKFKRLCPGCPHHAPMGTRVLVLKFGAMGDALRTTPILRGLKRLYPTSHITWITDPISYPLLAHNPFIDRLWLSSVAAIAQLHREKFDLVLSFDKVPEALALAEIAQSPAKRGFRLSEFGTLDVYNVQSNYSLLLGVSDPVKFYQNRLTYQQVIFEMAEMPYDREQDEYVLAVSDQDHARAAELLHRLGIVNDRPVIGLNTGCGPVFATKKWTQEGYIELAQRALDQWDVQVLLLGGKSEYERNQTIEKALGGRVINTGNDHDIKMFAAIIGRCDVVVTGDTVAMHLAIALKKQVIAIFGPTCWQEIDLYGRGEFVVTDFPCAPCYLKVSRMKPTCMEKIAPETVLMAVERCLKSVASLRKNDQSAV